MGRLAAVALLVCGAALSDTPAAPAQPIWPEKWREHQRVKATPVTPAEPRLWAELGGQAAERAVYDSPVGRFGATAYRLQDATAALAWYEYLRPETAVPMRGTMTVATTPGTMYVAHENYVLVFDGWRPLEAEFAALSRLLPNAHSGGGLPLLLSYLPEKGRRRNSERYIVGLHSLELFAPAVPGAAAGFEDGGEALTARYESPAGDMALLMFKYPTPQVAKLHEAAFAKLPGWQLRRTGQVVALVPPVNGQAADAAAANALLDSIDWGVEFTWYESARRHMPVNVAAMLWGAIELTGAVLAAVFFGGVLFASIGVWIRRRGLKDGEDTGLIVLRLNG